MDQIKLVALDLDGTLFDSRSSISDKNIEAIKRVSEKGVAVVISTGRPFAGIPFDQIKDTGIKYAITTNGSGVYEIATGKCLFESPLDNEISLPIVDYLLTKDMHMDAFIAGKAYSPMKCLEAAKKLTLPEEIKNYVIDSRIRVDDLKKFVLENDHRIQKMTLNFHLDENGNLVDREDVRTFLMSNPNINVVSGGYNNLEFTQAGVDKGVGLKKLSEYLNIPIEQTMAIGDTENDLSILLAAGTGVAMGNATEALKKEADYVTLSNDESGVAAAIDHFIPV